MSDEAKGLDVDSIVEALATPNAITDPNRLYQPGHLSVAEMGDRRDVGADNTEWLSRMDFDETRAGDSRALSVLKEIASTKRRTLRWLEVLGYQGVLELWRQNTKGLIAVVRRCEEETGEDFSAPLILDFMESHDQWHADLEMIWRTHAYLHEANWQEVAAGADEHNMVDVAKAKQLSQLAFERAGTLNREKLSKTAPQIEGNQGNVINVVLSRDGVNAVGPDAAQTAHRQQLTAKARVRYGTGRYVDPPGLLDWQTGRLSIPETKVDDYLMLKWLPDNFEDVVPESVAETVSEAPKQIESPARMNKDSHTLDLAD